MIATLLDLLFGCSHKNYSFPITARPGQRRSEAAMVTGTYVVCLDCGMEFPYDWHQMKFVRKPREETAIPAESYSVRSRAA